MEPYPLDDLAREVAEMPVEDEQDLLAFLPLAARLAALGRPEQLNRWSTLANKFPGRVDELLIERSVEGDWDLHEGVGQDLADAVIAAQDFACFLELQREIIPAKARKHFSAWIEEAEETSLDEEAVEELELFLERFPIPEEYRLNIVDTPLSTAEETLLAVACPPAPTQTVSWRDLRAAGAAVGGPGAEAPELVWACTESGAPADELKQSFGRLDRTARVDGIGPVVISRRLGDDWRVVIDIARSDGKPSGVRSVRLGLRPALIAEEGRDDRWVVDLRFLDSVTRLAALQEPLVLNFRNGGRLRMAEEAQEVASSEAWAAAASGMQGSGILSGLPVGSADVAAELGGGRHFEIEAEDGSWGGFLRVPRSTAPDAMASLRLNDREGQSIDTAEVGLYGIPLQMEGGHAQVAVSQLMEACKNPQGEPVIRLRWRGSETRGRLKAKENGGRPHGDGDL